MSLSFLENDLKASLKYFFKVEYNVTSTLSKAGVWKSYFRFARPGSFCWWTSEFFLLACPRASRIFKTNWAKSIQVNFQNYFHFRLFYFQVKDETGDLALHCLHYMYICERERLFCIVRANSLIRQTSRIFQFTLYRYLFVDKENIWRFPHCWKVFNSIFQ